MNGHTKSLAWRVLISEEMGEAADDDCRRFVAGVYAECGPRLYRYALMILADRRDEVVHLHVYEGMTFQEVANATAESINTVSARYRYALDKMRKMTG